MLHRRPPYRHNYQEREIDRSNAYLYLKKEGTTVVFSFKVEENSVKVAKKLGFKSVKYKKSYLFNHFKLEKCVSEL